MLGCGGIGGGAAFSVTHPLRCEPVFSMRISIAAAEVVGTRSAAAAKQDVASTFCNRYVW